MTLIVRPIQGVLTRDTNYFTSMDPYCFLYLGDQVKKTSPHFGGGTKPVWGQVLKFKLGAATKMGIQVWAKSIIGGDSLVGHALVDLTKMKIGNRPAMQDPIDIHFDNKPAGKIILQMQIVPSQTSQISQAGQIQTAAHQQQQNFIPMQNNYETSKVYAGNDFLRASQMSQFQTPMISQNSYGPLFDTQASKIRNLTEAAPNTYHPNSSMVQNPQFLAGHPFGAGNAYEQQKQIALNNNFNQQLYNSQVGSFYGSQISQPRSNPHLPINPQLQQFIPQSSQIISENSAFQNINNLGNIGNFVENRPMEAISAQTNQSNLRFRRSSLNNNLRSSLGNPEIKTRQTGRTPVKSILNNKSLGKQNTRGKSPASKRVQFADSVGLSSIH